MLLRMPRRPVVALALLSLLVACSSSSTNSPAPADAATDAPASCPTPPTPTVAATPETATLATDSAHCGVPAFRWRTGPDLGDVKTKGLHDHVDVSANQVLLAAGGVKATGSEVHSVDLDQIAYVTQDRGASIEATALVAYPSDDARKTAYDVLLVLHGTAGFNDACAPSSTASARPLAAALASLGYVVVAPDYIGLRGLDGPTGFLHPYLVGQTTGIASLDAVRAASKLLARGDATSCAAPRFLTLGGSQGGHAALWVDRLAPYYAQELEHVGVVATVPPADLLAEGVRALRSTVPATANMAAFYGAASDWYGVRARLSEVFVAPLDVKVPTDLAASCDPGSDFKGADRTKVFTPALLDAAATDGGLRALSPWGCMLAENGLTTTSVKRIAPTRAGYGVLFVLGEADTLVDPATERAGFDALCAQGMQLQYLECAGATHTKATAWALPEIVDFLRDRFAGKPTDPAMACKRGTATRCRGTPM